MTLYERYINGETEQVYKHISEIGQDAFLQTNLPDIEKVLTETFERVSTNLDIIYAELKKINYLFKTKFDYNFQRPLIRPLSNTEQLLIQLDETVKPFGFIPLSLKMFYRIVGGCNFGWDYDTDENYIWQFADPIQITSLDDIVAEMNSDNHLSFLKKSYEENGFVSLDLSADYFHKNNTSGGPAYSLKLTESPSIDSEFLNEEHATTFINYLRISFDNCGFARIKYPENRNDYQTFFDTVKPQLKQI